MIDIAAAAIISGLFILLLVVAETWSRCGDAKPEWTRKLVHVVGGLICLSFPFVLQSPWTVLVLAVSMSGLFVLGAETKLMHSLHRVKRRSRGSEYYPLSVFLVFILTQGRPWLYVSSMLVLAVADAFAALIGMRYGRIRYEVEDETKSLEGSLAFMAIAFVAMLVPLLAMTDLPRPVCFWSALLVASLVTGFEAVCLTGTDNLFVPIGTCVILSKITTKPLAEIMYQHGSLIGLFVIIALMVWRARSLNVGGALVLALFVYGSWSLGSEAWAIPALIGFCIYTLACVFMPLGTSLKVAVVFRAAMIPLLVLIVANMFQLESILYEPFLAALAMVLALAVWNHVRLTRSPVPLPNGFTADVLWSALHISLTTAAALVVLALRVAGIMPSLALP